MKHTKELQVIRKEERQKAQPRQLMLSSQRCIEAKQLWLEMRWGPPEKSSVSTLIHMPERQHDSFHGPSNLTGRISKTEFQNWQYAN